MLDRTRSEAKVAALLVGILVVAIVVVKFRTNRGLVPPAGVSVNAADSRVTLSWNPSRSAARGGALIYRNDIEIAAREAPPYDDHDVCPSTTYRYAVQAYDVEGRRSSLSPEMTIVTPAETTPAVFYVSPSGRDSNPGTEALPFQTVDRARSAVRQINRMMTGDIVENAIEFLDAPGEWFLDPSGELWYKPRPGEDLSNAVAVAPRLETLLKIEGTPETPVHDIDFRQLTFEYTTWLSPDQEGYVGDQAGVTFTEPHQPDETLYYAGRRIPGGIHIAWATRIGFERNVVRSLGGSGVVLYHGTQSVGIRGNMLGSDNVLLNNARSLASVMAHAGLEPIYRDARTGANRRQPSCGVRQAS